MSGENGSLKGNAPTAARKPHPTIFATIAGSKTKSLVSSIAESALEASLQKCGGEPSIGVSAIPPHSTASSGAPTLNRATADLLRGCAASASDGPAQWMKSWLPGVVYESAEQLRSQLTSLASSQHRTSEHDALRSGQL